MKNVILVLDIEATGFSPKKECILELGIVSLNIETGEIKELFNKTFKEPHFEERLAKHHAAEKDHHKIWIFDNSDMTIEEIMKSKDLKDYHCEIQDIFDNHLGNIVAWNNGLDTRFLENRRFMLGAPMSDPMRGSTSYFGLKNVKGAPKAPSLEEAVRILFPDEEYDEDHRGLADARDAARVIHKLIQLGVYRR